MDKNLGLYLHIPFCRHKCDYCDFYSITNLKLCQRYTDALILHMDDYAEAAKDYTVDTVFIGGGTPSVLQKKMMIDILGDGVFKCFNVSENAEITVEVNPATADLGLLKAYQKAGVTRLSIGMQSCSNNELAALSRIHTFEDFEDCYNAARKARFDNINIDVMYGIPEQNLGSLKNTLETVIEMRPEHISLYGLKIEDGTPFSLRASELNLPDEDAEYEMYETAIKLLSQGGYQQYEISNFALPGYECKHNLKYWNCQEYLGLGPAAHSYFGGSRFSFKKDVELYMDLMENPDSGESILNECYAISPSERVGEYVMLQLRLNAGLDTARFQDLFGLSFERMYGKYLTAFIDGGFMVHRGNCYALTTKGMYVSNYILSTMLDFDSDITEGIADGSDK